MLLLEPEIIESIILTPVMIRRLFIRVAGREQKKQGAFVEAGGVQC
jgi:hypothetical protein